MHTQVWPIIANEEVLAVSQSWFGHPGRLVANATEYRAVVVEHGSTGNRVSTEQFPSWQAWAKPVANGAVAVRGLIGQLPIIIFCCPILHLSGVAGVSLVKRSSHSVGAPNGTGS